MTYCLSLLHLVVFNSEPAIGDTALSHMDDSNDTIWGIRKAQAGRVFWGHSLSSFSLVKIVTVTTPYYGVYYHSQLIKLRLRKIKWLFTDHELVSTGQVSKPRSAWFQSSYSFQYSKNTSLGHFLNYTTLVLHTQSTHKTNSALYNYNHFQITWTIVGAFFILYIYLGGTMLYSHREEIK